MTIIHCLWSSTYLFAGETVRLTNGEWPPYLSKEMKHYGVASHVIESAFKNAGVTVEYGFFPWKRAFILAQRGNWDGSVLWSPSEERCKHFYFSDLVANDVNVFFHLKSKPFDWNNYSDLKGLILGATLAYDYGNDFTTHEMNGAIYVERSVKDETGFKKLLGKRIDLFVCNVDVGYFLIHKMYPIETASLFTNHPKSVKAAPLCLLLSKKIKKNHKLIEQFNNGLNQLKSNGKFDAYYDASRRGKYK
jgi:polar amino acid transport system substrate-binding protein